ncbi:MAG TPA: allantoicase [Pyrinomonadaceae bacterium]|nr:allantoicase [Pyrinomonadaceae bacterium]
MMDFTELIDLASEKLGGAVLYANDDFFAPKENLLKLAAPIFIEGKYTDLGKWMDGWETRRRRSPRLDENFDWCIVRLGLPGIIHGVVVDTSFFRGNFPSHCSLEACALDGHPTVEQLLDARNEWREILPQSGLEGDSQNRFSVNYERRATHLRLKIYPDGGVARLRVYGVVAPDWDALRRRESELDLAAVKHGGAVLEASDMFFGHKHNLIMPGRAQDMSDGWETKRRRGAGYDWCIIKLGAAGNIRRVEVDTSHFKGNYPESCSIEVCRADGELDSIDWQELLPNVKLQAHTRHVFVDELKDCGAATHARFNIYPDGGVSRLRLYGRISE